MKQRVKDFTKWISQRSLREQVTAFLVGFFIIYFFWNLFFSWPLGRSDRRIVLQIQEATSNISTVQQQTDAVLNIVRDNAFLQMLQEYRKTKTESETFTQYISKFSPGIIAIPDLSKVVTAILAAQGDVVLISLKKQPLEPLIPKELNVATLPASVKDIYKYALEIEFHGNYFTTIAYLQRLERLPWQIYWDSLDYKVLQYPEADVIVKLHVLIIPKSSI